MVATRAMWAAVVQPRVPPMVMQSNIQPPSFCSPSPSVGIRKHDTNPETVMLKIRRQNKWNRTSQAVNTTLRHEVLTAWMDVSFYHYFPELEAVGVGPLLLKKIIPPADPFLIDHRLLGPRMPIIRR